MIIPLVVAVAVVVVVPVFLSPSEPVVLSISPLQPPVAVFLVPSFSPQLVALIPHSFFLSKNIKYLFKKYKTNVICLSCSFFLSSACLFNSSFFFLV